MQSFAQDAIGTNDEEVGGSLYARGVWISYEPCILFDIKRMRNALWEMLLGMGDIGTFELEVELLFIVNPNMFLLFLIFCLRFQETR